MPSILGIAHVELSVRDIETSAAWYTKVLGLRRVFDNRDDERGLPPAPSLIRPAASCSP